MKVDKTRPLSIHLTAKTRTACIRLSARNNSICNQHNQHRISIQCGAEIRWHAAYGPFFGINNKIIMDNHQSTEPSKAEEHQESRRDFLKTTSILAVIAAAPVTVAKAAAQDLGERISTAFETTPVNFTVNGVKKKLNLEPRSTLLDVLREQMDLTGTKKGCDYGQCGACTVHVNGQRVLSCLSLAIMQEGQQITTIEGLAKGEELHPMQQAFIKHDGFQCGYCTPGQIMSAVACIHEGHAGSKEEIREYMSGNICRCGAYPNIVKAIQEVKNGGAKS